MQNNKDLYFVAVKVFLENKEGHLLITKDKFGDWDIPGGRLREIDFNTPLEEVVKRKIDEELGGKVQYQLGEVVVFMRHERDEHLSTGNREKRRIFAIGYSAKYLSGEIALGESHEQFKWINPADFDPEEYFTGGWLKGIKEYLDKRGHK